MTDTGSNMGETRKTRLLAARRTMVEQIMKIPGNRLRMRDIADFLALQGHFLTASDVRFVVGMLTSRGMLVRPEGSKHYIAQAPKPPQVVPAPAPAPEPEKKESYFVVRLSDFYEKRSTADREALRLSALHGTSYCVCTAISVAKVETTCRMVTL